MKVHRSSIAVALSIGAILLAPRASAYCRTTTCDTTSADDTSPADCNKNNQGCTTEGTPIAWKSTCMTYGVQVDGSTRRNITAQDVAPLMRRAFDTWSRAACSGGGSPPITAHSVGVVECNQPEFNCDSGDYNTNTVMFRDDLWPDEYSDTALAITTVTVDTLTGEILDADIEVNSKTFQFSLGDTNVSNDLLSVLTHEVGHFLGLAHSSLSHTTMFASYNTQSTAIRDLSADDIAGICSIYSAKVSDPQCTNALDTALECLPDTACLGGDDTCSVEPRCGEHTKSAPACAFQPRATGSNVAVLLLSLLGGSLVIARRYKRQRMS